MKLICIFISSLYRCSYSIKVRKNEIHSPKNIQYWKSFTQQKLIVFLCLINYFVTVNALYLNIKTLINSNMVHLIPIHIKIAIVVHK